MFRRILKKRIVKSLIVVFTFLIPVIIISAAGARFLRDSHLRELSKHYAATVSAQGSPLSGLNDAVQPSTASPDRNTVPPVLRDNETADPGMRENHEESAALPQSQGSPDGDGSSGPQHAGETAEAVDEDQQDQPSDDLEVKSGGVGGNPSMTSNSSTSSSLYVYTGDAGPLKIAYLTFDDGPSRSVTPGILDLLKEEGIKATFFVLPHSNVNDIYQRIIDEGHEIGNHSYSHIYSKLYKADDVQPFIDDVTAARDFIYDNFDYETVSFRFPGGAMGRKAAIVEPRLAILGEMGYRSFDWTVITGDADSRQYDKSAVALANNVLKNTRGRDKLIVLMHDAGDKKTTLEALPYIISGLRDQNYCFDVLMNY